MVTIEAYRLSLQRLILPADWQTDLQRLFIARSVHGTTAIEGNPLTQEEVSRQLAAASSVVPKDQVHRQTANAHAAFRWVESEFTKPRRITEGDLLSLHRMLTKGSDEKDNVPGRFRESGHNVTVGSPTLGGVHRPPPGGPILRNLVQGYLEFISSPRFQKEPVVLQALIAHYYFVLLHPFGDGNGRTSRCIEASFLMARGYNTYGLYSLANFFSRNRDEYIRTLQATHTTHKHDLTEFLRFGVRGFAEELERVNAYVLTRTHRLQYRDLIRRAQNHRVGSRRRLLNEREALLLHRILDETKPADPFSTESARELTWEEIFKLAIPLYRGRTARTSVREIIRLEKLGFLKATYAGAVKSWRFEVNFAAIAKY